MVWKEKTNFKSDRHQSEHRMPSKFDFVPIHFALNAANLTLTVGFFQPDAPHIRTSNNQLLHWHQFSRTAGKLQHQTRFDFHSVVARRADRCLIETVFDTRLQSSQTAGGANHHGTVPFDGSWAVSPGNHQTARLRCWTTRVEWHPNSISATKKKGRRNGCEQNRPLAFRLASVVLFRFLHSASLTRSLGLSEELQW